LAEEGSMDRPSDGTDELIVELRDRIRSLERRLEEGEESRKRADAIIARLTEANVALNERLRELEPPTQRPALSESCEEAVQGVGEEPPGPAPGVAEPPAASGKSSRLTITEGVTIGLIIFLVTTMAKVVFPVILSVAALVVAGVTAINGEFNAAIISVLVSIVGALIAYYFSRFPRADASEEFRQFLEHMESGARSRRNDGEDT
jgi:hypothetical protein